MNKHTSNYGVALIDPILSTKELTLKSNLYQDKKITIGYDPNTLSFTKECTICGKSFKTSRRNKNICSFDCKREHNRRHARAYARSKRHENREYPPCVICGFYMTTDMHEEGGEVYVLCPNHHALITRNIKTLKGLFMEKVVAGQHQTAPEEAA